MKQKIKLAMIQMTVEGGKPDKNLAVAAAKIAEAAKKNAKIALLPEAMNLGWTHPSAQKLAEAIPGGPSCQKLMKAAKDHGIYVCAGLVERDGDSVYNAAVLIDPKGEVLVHYRKINEIEPALQFYKTGDRLLAVDTPLGKIGVMICADAFIDGQVITRSLAAMGSEIILSPSAWAVGADFKNDVTPYGPLWLYHYGAVAKDFDVWIAGTSNVGWITDGPWKGQQCIGCSMVIAPGGEPAFRGEYGVDRDEIYYVDIELD